MAAKKARPAYSTGPSGVLPRGYEPCRRCGHWPCRCEPQASAPPERQAPRVRRERAGRSGKTVTTITPLVLSRPDATALMAELKRVFGTGGTIEAITGPDGKAAFTLELQGDHVDKVVASLVERGYPAKRAGG